MNWKNRTSVIRFTDSFLLILFSADNPDSYWNFSVVNGVDVLCNRNEDYISNTQKWCVHMGRIDGKI